MDIFDMFRMLEPQYITTLKQFVSKTFSKEFETSPYWVSGWNTNYLARKLALITV